MRQPVNIILGVCLVLVCACLLISSLSISYSGEAFPKPPSSPPQIILQAEAPELALLQRLHVSKKEQFDYHLPTKIAKEVERPKTIVAPGKVIASPEGYGQVHVPQLARVILDENFPLPHTGKRVEHNQVLAVVEPLLSAIDLTDKKTELYRMEGEAAILKRDIERLTALGEYAIKKDLENKKTELERTEKQKEQLMATSLGRELLRAPISGIVIDNHLLPGQIIQPNKAAIEIIDPTQFRIEAYTFNYIQADQIRSAWLRSPKNLEKFYKLSLIGLSPSIEEKDQSQHILLSIDEEATDLMIGMSLDVFLSMNETTKRIVVPQATLFKNGTEYTIFVLSGLELITAHPVQIGLFFEDQVEVISGLKKGDKIIASVAALHKLVTERGNKDHVQ